MLSIIRSPRLNWRLRTCLSEVLGELDHFKRTLAVAGFQPEQWHGHEVAKIARKVHGTSALLYIFGPWK